MRSNVLARKTHKWLGLFVGLQVVIWSLSGVYMTVVHIDTIHGDHLVRQPQVSGIDARALKDPISLASSAGAEDIRLTWVRGQPLYVMTSKSGEQVVGATTGQAVPRPTESQVRALARAAYTGQEPIKSAKLITEIPGEIRGRKPPLWRVEFSHWNKPTLYLSPTTGEVVSRRHELWRIFDFVWMLHIMDYDERENVNNPLLRVFTWGALLLALSGAWLLLYSFPKKKKKAAARA